MSSYLETSVGINKVVQSTLESGSGPYSNPLDIYSPGHKKYTDYIYGEKTQADISGIITNINLLKNGSELKIMHPKDCVREFDPFLKEDFILSSEYSGLSVNLNFNSHNVVTTTNEFRNF